MTREITDLTREELKDELAAIDEPAYRADQIFYWLYVKAVSGFEAMPNLSGALRNKLKARFAISPLSSAKILRSSDGTEKYLLNIREGDVIESVFIPSRGSDAVCISTQVGCKFACSFCASGRAGFKRNLLPGEIAGQVVFAKNEHAGISNVVYMGIGEPLDNFDNVVRSVLILTDRKGLDIPERRLTISTCGIPDAIERLKKSGFKVNLAVSLHAADDDTRSKIMPVNKKYPLKLLTQALQDYAKAVKSKIMLEYALIKGVNDSQEMAEKLALFAKRLRAKVNLISVNYIATRGDAAGGCEPPSEKERARFTEALKARGLTVTVRNPRGADIMAACGQLRAQ